MLTSGEVECWGQNISGELGNGTDSSDGSLVPVLVKGISNAMAVAAGGGYTCGLLKGGEVQCWGLNFNGELGNGTTTNSDIPVAVRGISNAVAIAAGSGSTCATLSDGSSQCWGDNTYGELGNGTTVNSPTPVTVTGITNARVSKITAQVPVVVGSGDACAVLSDGSVQCWGDNTYGQLGSGAMSTSPVSSPAAVSGVTNAVAVAEGIFWGCALQSGGTIRCWGIPTYAAYLGASATLNGITPVTVTVTGITNAIAVAAGDMFMCAVLSSGTVQCWGGNSDGELGIGFGAPDSNVPVTVTGISDAIAVSGASEHACVLLRGGKVQCWGNNVSGQLGTGTTVNSAVPVTVVGF